MEIFPGGEETEIPHHLHIRDKKWFFLQGLVFNLYLPCCQTKIFSYL